KEFLGVRLLLVHAGVAERVAGRQTLRELRERRSNVAENRVRVLARSDVGADRHDPTQILPGDGGRPFLRTPRGYGGQGDLPSLIQYRQVLKGTEVPPIRLRQPDDDVV